ncbi:DNA polymerase III subunit epsilon [Candidatus Campbellbacteria bacterium]|nr:MAG: DNA polymerase III subunit epsilon [Candidatus Campbellbacteria bacterium]
MTKKDNIFKNLIFLDTETTGVEKDDRLFQLAYVFEDKKVDELFNPQKDICIEASETTGYVTKDVKGKEVFENSKAYQELQKLLENRENILVAHNAKFDIRMLENENLKVPRFIDTLKVAQKLDTACFFGAYRLQYLRYAMELEVENAQAHDALGDVLVLQELFQRLYLKMEKQFQNREAILEEMIKISSEPVLIKKFVFGKYKGLTVEDVAKQDQGYLEWLLNEKEKQKAEGDVDEDWIYTLNYYLK